MFVFKRRTGISFRGIYPKQEWYTKFRKCRNLIPFKRLLRKFLQQVKKKSINRSLLFDYSVSSHNIIR